MLLHVRAWLWARDCAHLRSGGVKFPGETACEPVCVTLEAGLAL